MIHAEANHRWIVRLRHLLFRALLHDRAMAARTPDQRLIWRGPSQSSYQVRYIMKSGFVQLSVPLSHLVPSRRNPRKVKPSRQAHQRLVALIRSQGLLQPLVVRPTSEGILKRYEVVAGDRRLKALREIHRGDGDPKIPCVLRDVDAVTADAMSLGENFAREAMHPLDEAEAFAKLATSDGKDAQAIAAEFSVSEHYVKQRMKLATLAEPVKAAHREG